MFGENVEQCRRTVPRQVQERIKIQDRRFLLGNLLTAAVFPGGADLRRLYQPSGELARKTLGNRRLCFGVRVCRISPLDSAGNVACRDTVDSRLRRALA